MQTDNIAISGKQAVMARAALGWSLPDVRARTGFSVNTVLNFEKGRGTQLKTMTTLAEIYQREGVRFLPDGKTVTSPA